MDEDPRKGLSDKQIKILIQFRENVKDVLKPEHDDFYLLRWLRAREYDLKKSEDMIRKSVAWRKKWKVDTLLTDWTPPDIIKKYYPVGFAGFDKEGSPVWIFPSRNLHMKSISMAVKRSDILRYNIYLMELVRKQCREQSEKLGRRVDKSVLINDLDGFSVKQLFMPGMDIILKYLGMIEANYPESLKYGFMINGPMIFPVIYNLVKPLLSEHTKRKIRVLGRDWKQKLLTHIDPDQLPVYWGGTDEDADGDPYCQSRICLGGTVPSELFLNGSQLVDESKVTQATIGRSDTLELTYNVDQSGMALRWVFWTKNYDIKFSISYTGDGSQSTEPVVPAERISCHHVPEDGIYECEQLGTYVVKFDNTYSWVHSKHLSYSIELLRMDELQSDSTSVYSLASAGSGPTSSSEAGKNSQHGSPTGSARGDHNDDTAQEPGASVIPSTDTAQEAQEPGASVIPSTNTAQDDPANPQEQATDGR